MKNHCDGDVFEHAQIYLHHSNFSSLFQILLSLILVGQVSKYNHYGAENLSTASKKHQNDCFTKINSLNKLISRNSVLRLLKWQNHLTKMHFPLLKNGFKSS